MSNSNSAGSDKYVMSRIKKKEEACQLLKQYYIDLDSTDDDVDDDSFVYHDNANSWLPAASLKLAETIRFAQRRVKRRNEPSKWCPSYPAGDNRDDDSKENDENLHKEMESNTDTESTQSTATEITKTTTPPPPPATLPSSTSCIAASIFELLPASIIPCSLGPEPRATHLIASSNNKKKSKGAVMAALLSPGEGVVVVPLVKPKDDSELAWSVAETLQDHITQSLHEHLPMGSMGSVGNDAETGRLDLDPAAEFILLCKLVAAGSEQWQQKLDELWHPTEGSSSSVIASEGSIVASAGSIMLRSLQRNQVLVGTPRSSIDLFMTCLERRQQVTMPCFQTPSSLLPLQDAAQCLICFDECPSDAPLSRIHRCGHRICVDCWKAYVVCAAKSGNATTSILCPAPSCDYNDGRVYDDSSAAAINVLDAAHILSHDDLGADGRESLRRMIDNEIEQLGILKSGRYCPSPTCGRLLVQQQTHGDDHSQPSSLGWNIFQCLCGTSFASCADCGIGRAHPGMSCGAYKKLHEEINSGAVSAEFQDYQWLLTNSRPCPRCKFSIQRSAGCNHMWCSNCSYYFCWECGGPGSECGSFNCSGRNENWHESEQFQGSSYDDIREQVSLYKSLCRDEQQLRKLEKRLRSDAQQHGESNSKLKEEMMVFQLLQVILWIESVIVSTPFGGYSIEKSCVPLQRLRLIVHAISVRDRMEDITRKKNSKISEKDPVGKRTLSRLEAFASAVGVSDKLITKRKQSISNKFDTSITEGALITDFNLQELCLMDSKELRKYVQLAMQQGARFLIDLDEERSKKSRRRRRARRKGHEEHCSIAVPLNVKMPRREGWPATTSAQDGGTKTVRSGSVKWKGKTKAKCRHIVVHLEDL